MLTHFNYEEELKSYTTPSSNVLESIYKAVNDIGHRGSGKGPYYNRFQTNMSRTDRFGQNPLAINHENVGLTFITKPRLNLSTSNIRRDPVLSTLDTMDPTSLAFGMRCYLDSRFATTGNSGLLAKKAYYYDSDTCYIDPLSNNLIQLHGHPPFDLQTVTSDDGFFSENQTIAKGCDFNNQTYDLSLTFRDTIHNPILYMLYYWVYWIGLLCKGEVERYMEDTLANRLNYTCSIYRFTLNEDKTRIISYSKATGCFPRNSPINEKFDITSRTHFIDALQEFTVSFVANHVSYMDPNILTDFNRVMSRYCGNIYNRAGTALNTDRVILKNTAENNFKGIPFINTWSGRRELMWLGDKNESESNIDASLAALKEQVAAETARLQAIEDSVNARNSENEDYTDYSEDFGLGSSIYV